MSPATKEQAVVKLKGIEDKIGYPARWHDYSSVKIVRDSWLNNVGQAIIVRVRALGCENWQAGRSLRMDDDSAHHQRLLRSAAEYHQFPGRHSAAALL